MKVILLYFQVCPPQDRQQGHKKDLTNLIPGLFFFFLSLSVVSNSLQPMDSIVHGILQARILAQVAIPFLQGIFPTQG